MEVLEESMESVEHRMEHGDGQILEQFRNLGLNIVNQEVDMVMDALINEVELRVSCNVIMKELQDDEVRRRVLDELKREENDKKRSVRIRKQEEARGKWQIKRMVRDLILGMVGDAVEELIDDRDMLEMLETEEIIESIAKLWLYDEMDTGVAIPAEMPIVMEYDDLEDDVDYGEVFDETMDGI